MKSILQFAVAAAICVLGYVFLLSVMRGAPYDTGLAIPALVLAVALFALNVVFFGRERLSLAVAGGVSPNLRVQPGAIGNTLDRPHR